MHSMTRLTAAFAVAVLVASPATAHAQTSTTTYKQAVSANPFGLLLDVFNAEYERVVGESTTAGVGGSTISSDTERYANADLFVRYYPTGKPLDGWAFGVKAGITSVTDYATYFGYGFDVNRSWLLGKKNNFYVGLGFGLKRLVGTPKDDYSFDLKYIPTIRIVNVGFAF